jgi:FHA domain
VAEAVQSESVPEWRPRDLIGRARRESREIFVRGHRAKLFLVIVLDGPASELALGLNAAHAGESDGLPFRTAALTGNYAPVDPGRPNRPSLSAQVDDTPMITKLRALAQFPCHVIPLRKRVEAAFLSSISVGRARNHDIVLRHASVSKFHANLEIEEGHLFIKDAGSRNHTFVNHERVLSRVEVKPGDNLRFGWVEAMVCHDEALWHAVNAG